VANNIADRELLRRAISMRNSTRSYTGAALDNATLAELRQLCATLSEAPLRIELMSGVNGNVGTYGMVRGSSATLALVGPPTDSIRFRAGRAGEEAILWLTAKGYGTCWLGGTFSRKDVRSAIKLSQNEQILAIIVTGHSSSRPGFIDRVARNFMHSRNRLPFDQLFRIENGGEIYHDALEAVRLAPSARNKQPWRAVARADGVDFFAASHGDFTMLDMGIALTHFLVSAPAAGILDKNHAEVEFHKAEYVISFRPD